MRYEIPNWNNILQKYCPLCGNALMALRQGSACESPSCTFFIRAERMQDLLQDMRRQYAEGT